MKKNELESIKRDMAQAQAFLRGERDGFVIHEAVNVKEIRARTKLTRDRFAARYGLDKRTVEQWEEGQSHPDRTSETCLRLIESKPEEVAAMVSQPSLNVFRRSLHQIVKRGVSVGRRTCPIVTHLHDLP